MEAPELPGSSSLNASAAGSSGSAVEPPLSDPGSAPEGLSKGRKYQVRSTQTRSLPQVKHTIPQGAVVRSGTIITPVNSKLPSTLDDSITPNGCKMYTILAHPAVFLFEDFIKEFLTDNVFECKYVLDEVSEVPFPLEIILTVKDGMLKIVFNTSCFIQFDVIGLQYEGPFERPIDKDGKRYYYQVQFDLRRLNSDMYGKKWQILFNVLTGLYMKRVSMECYASNLGVANSTKVTAPESDHVAKKQKASAALNGQISSAGALQQQGNDNVIESNGDFFRYYKLVEDNSGKVVSGKRAPNGNLMDYFTVHFMVNKVFWKKHMVDPMLQARTRKFTLSGSDRRSSEITVPGIKKVKGKTKNNGVKLFQKNPVERRTNKVDDYIGGNMDYVGPVTFPPVTSILVTSGMEMDTKKEAAEEVDGTKQTTSDASWIPSGQEWSDKALASIGSNGTVEIAHLLLKLKNWTHLVAEYDPQRHSEIWPQVISLGKNFSHIPQTDDSWSFDSLVVSEFLRKDSACISIQTLETAFAKVIRDVNSGLIPWGLITLQS